MSKKEFCKCICWFSKGPAAYIISSTCNVCKVLRFNLTRGFHVQANVMFTQQKPIRRPAAINWLPNESCPEASQEYCNNHLNVQHAILQCYIILKKMSKSEAGSLRMTKLPSKYISLLLCYHHSDSGSSPTSGSHPQSSFHQIS